MFKEKAGALSLLLQKPWWRYLSSFLTTSCQPPLGFTSASTPARRKGPGLGLCHSHLLPTSLSEVRSHTGL